MDQTTRALAVLAAAVVLLAPLVNGVLEEAAATADRVFLKDTDWNGDPPEDPPDQPPPEDLNRSDLDRNMTGPGGGQPNCEVERRLVAGWNHESYEEDPLTAAGNRSQLDSPQAFEVNDTDIGMGVAFTAENVSGTLEASVYQDGQSENPVFEVDKQQPLEEDLNDDGEYTPPQLKPGTWYASLDNEGAHYDTLQFVVFLFSCPQEGSA